MSFEFFILNGYGQFVWPAFIFTFVVCYLLYFKTKNEFKKQEKMYLKEFGQPQTIKTKIIKKKEALSGSSI